jgi:hypothetical protein
VFGSLLDSTSIRDGLLHYDGPVANPTSPALTDMNVAKNHARSFQRGNLKPLVVQQLGCVDDERCITATLTLECHSESPAAFGGLRGGNRNKVIS